MTYTMTGNKKNISSKKNSDIFCHHDGYTFISTIANNMKTPSTVAFQIIRFVLILLWTYAASSKLIDFGMFRAQMHRQVLFPFMKPIIIYGLPLFEIATALLLLFDRTCATGLYISGWLMLSFTIYVGLAVFKLLGKVPCSCGGVISSMGWNLHLAFNIFFLLAAVLGIYMIRRERRLSHK
jgi:putative oxidoreductase